MSEKTLTFQTVQCWVHGNISLKLCRFLSSSSRRAATFGQTLLITGLSWVNSLILGFSGLGVSVSGKWESKLCQVHLPDFLNSCCLTKPQLFKSLLNPNALSVRFHKIVLWVWCYHSVRDSSEVEICCEVLSRYWGDVPNMKEHGLCIPAAVNSTDTLTWVLVVNTTLI